jgi:hypothetical protein
LKKDVAVKYNHRLHKIFHTLLFGCRNIIETNIMKKLFSWMKTQLSPAEVIIYLIILIGGSLMPVWGGIVLYKLFNIYPGFYVFVDDGQFFIYGASLFTPACYILYKYKDSDNFLHSLIFLVSILLLLLSAILFAGISAASFFEQKTLINFNFLRGSSLVIFVLSIVSSFIAQRIQYKIKMGGPNLREEEKAAFQDLEDKYNALG